MQTESWKNLKKLVAVFYALLLIATFFISPLSPFAAAHADSASGGRLYILKSGFGSQGAQARYLVVNTQTGWSFYAETAGGQPYISGALEPGLYRVVEQSMLRQDGLRARQWPLCAIRAEPADAVLERNLIQRSALVRIDADAQVFIRYENVEPSMLRLQPGIGLAPDLH